MQIGTPPNPSVGWKKFFMYQLALGRARSQRFGCYISYQADMIRNAPVQAAKGVCVLMETTGVAIEGRISLALSDPEIARRLKQHTLPGGLRLHPARLPCVSNAHEVLLLAAAFSKSTDSLEEQLCAIEAGLATFSGDVESVARLPVGSPVRVPADDEIFGSMDTFNAAV